MQDAFAALERLYAQLPRMQCQGLCADSCFSLVQTRLERDFVAVRAGVQLGLVQAPPTACPALTMLRQCSVYETRPMICRLWGMTRAMKCQYGCEPEGGFLTGQQTYEFLAQVAELDGDPVMAARLREPFLADPGRAEKVLLGLQRERDLAYEDRVRRAGGAARYVTAEGLSKRRPRGGHW